MDKLKGQGRGYKTPSCSVLRVNIQPECNKAAPDLSMQHSYLMPILITLHDVIARPGQ